MEKKPGLLFRQKLGAIYIKLAITKDICRGEEFAAIFCCLLPKIDPQTHRPYTQIDIH